MRKKLFLLIFLMVPPIFLYGFASPVRANENQDSAIIILLSPYIEMAINEHCKDKVVYDFMGQTAARQTDYSSAKVDSIIQVAHSLTYEIKVTVCTFYNAHNPPYANEEMTFAVSPLTEPKLIAYKHIPA